MIWETKAHAVYTVPNDILRTSDDHDEVVLACIELFKTELHDAGYRFIDDSVQVQARPWYVFKEDALLIYVHALVEPL